MDDEGLNVARALEETIQREAAEAEAANPPDNPPDSWVRKNVKSYPGAEKQQLPHPVPAPMSVGDVLSRRRSCRSFSGEAVPLTALASALGSALLTRGDALSRPYPSAGARWPVETYVIARNVEGLAEGAYHYDAADHMLARVNASISAESLAQCFRVQEFGPLPQAVAVATATFTRSWARWGIRGSRFAYQEAGAAIMALDLASTAAGLDTVWLGGFDDVLLSEILGLDWSQDSETPVLGLGIGRAVPE